MLRHPSEKWNVHRQWDRMLPPGRPSTFHLRFFAQHLRSLGAGASVCVLGSTPELRDLCVESAVEDVTVIDASAEFHEQTRQLRVYPDAPERVIHSRWEEALPGLDGQFDAVLSDLTLGNVPYSERDAFFAGLRSALRPGGLFIDKVLTHGARLKSLDVLDAKYAGAPLNLATINDFGNEYFFLSEAIEDENVDIARATERLRQRFVDRPRLLRLLDEANEVVGAEGVWSYGRPWQRVRGTYCKGLVAMTSVGEPAPSVFEGALRLIAHRKPGGRR